MARGNAQLPSPAARGDEIPAREVAVHFIGGDELGNDGAGSDGGAWGLKRLTGLEARRSDSIAPLSRLGVGYLGYEGLTNDHEEKNHGFKGE